MSGDSLTVCKLADFSVLFSACAGCVEEELVGELLSFLCKAVVVGVCFFDSLNDGLAVPVPVGGELVAEVFDGLYVVIGECEESGGSASGAKVSFGGHECHFFLEALGSLFVMSAGNEGRSNLFGVSLAGIYSEVEVAPVDSDVVAGYSENGLLYASDFNAGK